MRRLTALLIAFVSTAFASADANSLQLQVELETASVGGTLLLPGGARPVPCVVIVGGTMSHLRDGQLIGAPERTALKRFAGSLAAVGYASFRYDQVGKGESRAKTGYRDLYGGDAEVLAGIYRYLRTRPECSKLVAAGESAGAYIVSLAARAGAHADAYLFLGGFCGKAEEIFEYNFGRLRHYVDQSAEHAAWARQNKLDRSLAFGRNWQAMFAAAHAGKSSFEIDGQTIDLARRREEIDNPPDEMFAYVKGPALALAGTRDLNVAPHHAACAVAVMQRAGNLASRSILIEGADHSFQIAAADTDLALRERHTFASFRRPYQPQFDAEIVRWLRDVAPPGEVPAGVEPQTSVSPARIQLAPGVTIIDDILKARHEAGVETLEGVIGPLLRVPGMRAHYIDMPAGLYLDEHPHSKGSIIYTVRGQWALKSLGRWHHMKPGSLYWFGDNIPTGFQVPFKEDAYILIFKAVPGDDDASFHRYLRGLAANLKKEQSDGTVFRLADLPAGHSAREYGRKLNPRLDRDFPSRRK